MLSSFQCSLLNTMKITDNLILVASIALLAKVLGQLPPRKITPLPPNPNSNANAKPNPNPNRGAIFLGGNCPDTVTNSS